MTRRSLFASFVGIIAAAKARIAPKPTTTLPTFAGDPQPSVGYEIHARVPPGWASSDEDWD